MTHRRRRRNGRITDPDRYEALIAAARTALDDLSATYAVERRDYETDHPHLRDVRVSATDLVPAEPAAGSLTVVVFPAARGPAVSVPGLGVRLGLWREFGLPACGCDACDEDPDELAEALHDEIGALVDGRFEERLTRGWRPTVGFAWTTHDGHGMFGEQRVSRRQARQWGPSRHIRWAPWPRNAS